MASRRDFLKKTVIGAAGVSVLSSSKAFGSVIGANSTLNAAIIGTGGRAHGLAKSIGKVDGIRLTHICDVDKNRVNKFVDYCTKNADSTPKTEEDFRKILENGDVDVVFIATPEHWHAPMAIMAMEAGKHVYVEKPCSHNPHETELLIEAQQKYGKHCQMGNQQRSSKSSALAIKEIGEGIIGKAYAAKAFYANTRKSIGVGKQIDVPAHLNWDLWQGPAPREAYRNNVHPYNWHWFKAWGTGEIHNNGTHEIDICRWALGVDYPTRVVSTGGRLHFTDDDWEYYDTQLASYEFEGGKTIHWEGRSCNGFRSMGGRGATIHGTEGSIYLDRSKYVLYDLKGKIIKTIKEANAGTSNNTSDTRGFDGLTPTHVRNLVAAIKNGERLHAPIADAAISTQLCHLGNIAQELQESLKVDPKTGHVLDNKNAKKMWKREYEKGWEPKV